MPAPRMSFVNLGGLQTSPGKEPKPGACSVLKNLRPVAPNKLRGIAKFGTPTQGGATNGTIVRNVELRNGKYATIQTTGGTNQVHYGANDAANAYSIPSYTSAFGLYNTNSIFPVVARDRVLLNSREGVLVSDYVDPDFTQSSNKVLRMAALPQPAIVSITEATGSSIPDDTMVSYAAVIRREYSDGYTLTSPPSPVVRRLNDSGATADNTVRIQWGYADDVKAGDVVELYRSNGINGASVSYSNTDTGSQCFLVAWKTLDSTDATNKYVDLTDLQVMSAPLYETYGTELYTNGDATLENNQPPVCAAQCSWQTFTFYGAIEEDPVLVLDTKALTGGLLTSAWERTNGVGTRAGNCNPISPGDTAITGIAAADIVGIKAGMQWAEDASTFPTGTYVVAVGVSALTMSAPATAPGVGFAVADVVTLDGVDYRAGFWFDLASKLGQSGKYEVHSSTTLAAERTTEIGVTISIRPIHHQATMTVKLTNAQNYSGAFEEWTGSPRTISRKPQGNLLRYSKSNQPEAVPYVNELRVGLGTIVSVHATTGYVYICCTDGVYWLTGSEGNFRVEPLDQNLIVAGPMAASAMNERVYALTNRGFVTFDASGAAPLSKDVVEDIIPGRPYSASATYWVQGHADAEEVWIMTRGATEASASTIYIYSTRYNMFFQLELSGTDAYTRTLSVTLGTSTSLPVVSVGLYTSAIAAPRYARFDGTGTALPITALLREAGDVATVKQWIDFLVVFDLASAGQTAQSLVNSTSPLGTATMQAARVDARANFGIPRSDAVRPQLAAGFRVAAPSRLIDVLGLSFRVVPKTTQSEVR